MWTDSHCHVPYEGSDADVIDAARAAGVTRMITVGTDAAQSAAAIEVAGRHDGVWATVGLHPHDAVEGVDGDRRPRSTTPDPRWSASGSAGSTTHYDHSPAAGAAGGVRGPDRAWPAASTWPW